MTLPELLSIVGLLLVLGMLVLSWFLDHLDS